MGKKVLIFGCGTFAAMIRRFIARYTDWDTLAFVADASYCNADSFEGLPLVSFDDIAIRYPPREVEVVAAIGYKGMAIGRKDAFLRLKAAGYAMPNLIHPSAFVECDEIGEGNLILEQCDICFGSKMGNCNLFWGGAMLSHDTAIGSFNTFARADFGGFCRVGDNCFFGLNSTVKDHVHVADFTFVGPCCYIAQDTAPRSVYLERGTKPMVGLESSDVL